MSKKILIIGSGIAGIAASLKLKSYGLESTVVDKGNFIGGRIGTREKKIGKNTYYFFHGAQFFSAHKNNFQNIINAGVQKNYIKEFGNFSPSRFRGFPTMQNFLLNLSKDINVLQKYKVTDLKKINDKIKVLDNINKNWNVFDAVISTIPAPQNIELMDDFPILKQSLKTASYDACIAIMFYFDKKPLNIPTYFDFYDKDSILSWMAAGSNIKFWTAHTRGSYSNLNLNTNKSLIKNQTFSSINDCFLPYKNIPNIHFSSLHIWRYAKIKKIVIGKQIDPEFPIAIAGDFMEGPNIESAFISGEKAADLIFDRLS
ncbi:NAD(P)-binding protein [Alphaproteobacteria bacterium]|nr:NAD(P)-binding protein [Alphaproteobacteria bacterium]